MFPPPCPPEPPYVDNHLCFYDDPGVVDDDDDDYDDSVADDDELDDDQDDDHQWDEDVDCREPVLQCAACSATRRTTMDRRTFLAASAAVPAAAALPVSLASQPIAEKWVGDISLASSPHYDPARLYIGYAWDAKAVLDGTNTIPYEANNIGVMLRGALDDGHKVKDMLVYRTDDVDAFYKDDGGGYAYRYRVKRVAPNSRLYDEINDDGLRLVAHARSPNMDPVVKARTLEQARCAFKFLAQCTKRHAKKARLADAA